MRILFVVPVNIPFNSFVNPSPEVRWNKKKDGKYYHLPTTDLPLSFLSMSAFLKKTERVDIRLKDFNHEIALADSFDYASFYEFSKAEFANSDFNPDIIGISCLFSPSFHNFMECGQAAKEVFPDALIIGGGNIPTSAFHHIYNGKNANIFDALCFGEGELPLRYLVRAENKKSWLESNEAKSWITKDKVVRGFVPQHDFIENLDEIPFFDYDLCSIDDRSPHLTMSSFSSLNVQRSLPVITSRGCPFHCTFCASHAVHGRTVRSHSIERTVNDFELLKNKYGASALVFLDDHFMFDRERVISLLMTIGKLELTPVFQSGLALYSLDRPMLEYFYETGVRHLMLPVESGSQRVLTHLMKKPLKLDISQRVANDCRELGIYTNTFIMIGMPGETKDDIEETRKNLRTINSNWFFVSCASPLVGSEMHEMSLKSGFISGDTLGSEFVNAGIQTPDFSKEYIQQMKYELNLELNFVNNNDMRFKRYDLALTGFEHTIKAKSDHAFAWYYAGKCHEQLGNHEKAEECLFNYRKFSKLPFWEKYIQKFIEGNGETP